MKAFLMATLLILMTQGSVAARERFACNLKALTSKQRVRHGELTRTMLAAVQQKREVVGGNRGTTRSSARSRDGSGPWGRNRRRRRFGAVPAGVR